MRRTLLFLVLIPCIIAQKKPITLDALDEISKLRPVGPGNPLSWAPDGTRFIYREDGHLKIYDIPNRTSKELIDTAVLQSAAVKRPDGAPEPFDWENRRVSESSVQWSGRGSEVLSVNGGDAFLIDIASGKWTQLTKTPVAERDFKLSSDGKSLAFRRDWDLYVIDVASKRETRLTTGGSDTLRNGGLDWVYPEELDLGTAYWWSPDSKTIAYFQFDTSHEPIFPHEDLRREKAIYEPQRYPQAGDNNPDVRLGVVSAGGGQTRWMQSGDTRNTFLLARVTWTPDSRELYLVRTNRVQDQLELLSFDADSGKSKRIFEETDKYWINVQDEPHFISGGKQFLWTSERDGFRHIYLYSSDGKLVRQLTKGPWEVTAINGMDESAGRVYYTSSEPSPLERHFYSIGLNGETQKQLTSGAGTHTVTMGPGAKYYLESYSSMSSPPRLSVHAPDGRDLGTYREADRRIADQYEILPTELVNFKTSDGIILYARLIRPAGFQAEKKYPAVVLVYGGPQAQGVRNAWMGADLDQVLAHEGFVVWQVDNRGSAGRGHSFETPVYRNLGPTELKDQVAGIDCLVSLGFVNRERVGIRGWSYGGFMTLNAMLNAPGVFRAGAAGAPVTNWLNYDTIYTERYMGLPKDNAEGYKSTALPPKAANLVGKLMILHNLEDDNVLFQNSVQMIDALEKAGKQFELAVYTQKTHAVTGSVTRQMNQAMVEFFERNLK